MLFNISAIAQISSGQLTDSLKQESFTEAAVKSLIKMQRTKEISKIRSSLSTMTDLYTGTVHSNVNVFSYEYLFSWSLCTVHSTDYKDDLYEGKHLHA